MPKRGENIYKRKDGRWEGRYRKARNEQGRLVYGYVYGHKYGDVKTKLDLLKAKYTFPLKNSALFSGTVEEWMNHWLDHIIIKQIKPSTYSSYRMKMTQHIFPLLGKKKLTQVSEKEIEVFIQALSDKDLSSTTILSVVTILKSAFTKACTEKVLIDNPCITILLPKIKKKEISILSLKQQQELEKIALKEASCSPVIIALYTGLRIGEISGLTWSDIDLENKIINVNRTVQRITLTDNKVKTKIIFGSPKSKSSIRMIPIAKNLLSYLKEKKRNATSTYVISSKDTFAEPRLISYRFKKNISQANIPDIHFHVLRHTFATRCIEQGIDVATLSKLLGHNSTKMTLDTYTGSLWETREKAISIIDNQLNLDM